MSLRDHSLPPAAWTYMLVLGWYETHNSNLCVCLCCAAVRVASAAAAPAGDSYIASPASSWLDDYLAWVNPELGTCCR